MARSKVHYKDAVKNIRRMASVSRPINEASRESLKPMLVDAKANLRTVKASRYVPGPNVVTRQLVRGLVARLKSKKAGETVHVVGAQGKAIKSAHLVEFGTDPHWQPKRKIMHPGAQPFPFMTPAFEKNRASSVRIFNKSIIHAMEALARRIGAKRKK